MVRFIEFLKKIHFPLLFIVLEALAINFYANSTSYTKVRMVTISNSLIGGIHSQLAVIGDYFHLRKENDALINEIALLRNELDARKLVQEVDSVVVDSAIREYEYFTARIVNKTITRQENYITLDKGVDDGFEPNMAIISDGSVVGYSLGCSSQFTVCMSILNTSFKTSGRVKGTNFTGSVYWDGISASHVVMTEVPKYAEFNIGDTIVTTDYSDKFPPELNIGIVESFELQNATYYNVSVKLTADMATLNNVVAIKYLAGEEKRMIEESMTSQPAN